LINSKGNIYGFLLLSHPENNENPSKEIFETAEFFSNVYSVVFENYINYFKIRNLAIYDELTGLFNFRYFSFRLKGELRRCERYNRPLSLIMIDIDHFKKYNDRNGHDNGNLVLRKTAELMKSATREIDFVCRYGGEEFSIILPETEQHEATMVGERVRKLIENFVFPYQEKQPTGNLTISMGLAEYPKEAKNAQELIKRADKKLYKAKESGRNRLVF
jgi:diguanylate cyclase (GGDEF)-like protein